MYIPQKETLEKMYELCDLVANQVDLQERLGLNQDVPISTGLKMNILYFLAYLAASDGVISWNESSYISELLDISMTPDKLNEFIIEENIYSKKFERDVPVMLQILVAFDNAIYRSDVTFDEEVGSGLIKLYLLLGMGLVESNGRDADTMDSDEKKDFETYITMMQKYVEENTESHHVDVITGYSKSEDSEDKAEKKDKSNGSVKAPRKKL